MRRARLLGRECVRSFAHGTRKTKKIAANLSNANFFCASRGIAGNERGQIVSERKIARVRKWLLWSTQNCLPLEISVPPIQGPVKDLSLIFCPYSMSGLPWKPMPERTALLFIS